MYVIDPVAMVTEVLTLHLNFIESASVSFGRENFSRRVSKSHRCPGGHFPGGGLKSQRCLHRHYAGAYFLC